MFAKQTSISQKSDFMDKKIVFVYKVENGIYIKMLNKSNVDFYKKERPSDLEDLWA